MGSGRLTSYIFAILLLFLISSEADAQLFKRATIRRTEKNIAGSNRKVIQSPKVRKAIKEQKKQQAREKKLYNTAVQKDREHRISNQSSDVQERMKLDNKERKIRDKERRKNEVRKARKSGSSRKYKRR